MTAPLVIPCFIPVPNGKGCREKQRTEAAKPRTLPNKQRTVSKWKPQKIKHDPILAALFGHAQQGE